ncbi:MAG: response regulator [Lachnospiraceae bacterium]|nr:response regulator [Lachnospiraceae bacterium]
MMEKMKILAVDDNSISLATIEHELKKDYEVVPINSGDRALQYLRREKPDLILMDIQMAQMSGIETLREIRGMEKCKDIPVIMLTSKQDKASVVESSKLGIYDYVIKPFNGEDLNKRIDRVLKEHKHL